MEEELKDFSFVLNEDEEIKQITDFPDYWISNYGRVFSYKKIEKLNGKNFIVKEIRKTKK